MRNGQPVAVKDLILSMLDYEDEAMHNEIKIGRKLQHRNVVETLGYCISDKVVSICWDGQNAEAIERRGPWSSGEETKEATSPGNVNKKQRRRGQVATE